jgi:hypothetical protein
MCWRLESIRDVQCRASRWLGRLDAAGEGTAEPSVNLPLTAQPHDHQAWMTVLGDDPVDSGAHHLVAPP